jgi:hypothetical protein
VMRASVSSRWRLPPWPVTERLAVASHLHPLPAPPGARPGWQGVAGPGALRAAHQPQPQAPRSALQPDRPRNQRAAVRCAPGAGPGPAARALAALSAQAAALGAAAGRCQHQAARKRAPPPAAGLPAPVPRPWLASSAAACAGCAPSAASPPGRRCACLTARCPTATCSCTTASRLRATRRRRWSCTLRCAAGLAAAAWGCNAVPATGARGGQRGGEGRGSRGR